MFSAAAGAEGFSRAMIGRPPKRGMDLTIPARIRLEHPFTASGSWLLIGPEAGSLPGIRDLARSLHLILGDLSRGIG